MNENILNKFKNGKIYCHNCDTVVKLELLEPDEYKRHQRFYCTCQSICGYVNGSTIKCWLSFKNNNIAYDLNFDFNNNNTMAFCYDNGIRNDEDRIMVNIENFCPFEHSVGKIVDVIRSTRLLQ